MPKQSSLSVGDCFVAQVAPRNDIGEDSHDSRMNGLEYEQLQ